MFWFRRVFGELRFATQHQSIGLVRQVGRVTSKPLICVMYVYELCYVRTVEEMPHLYGLSLFFFPFNNVLPSVSVGTVECLFVEPQLPCLVCWPALVRPASRRHSVTQTRIYLSKVLTSSTLLLVSTAISSSVHLSLARPATTPKLSYQLNVSLDNWPGKNTT